MNIKSINPYNNFSVTNFKIHNSRNEHGKSNPTYDSFCGTKAHEKAVEIDNSLNYIKAFFEAPIQISPTISMVFSTPEGNYAAVNLNDEKLENAIRVFYDYTTSKEDKQKFCELAKHILKINSKKDGAFAIPTPNEILMNKKLNAMVAELEQTGISANNKHYEVKYAWKFNPYTTLRCALANNTI